MRFARYLVSLTILAFAFAGMSPSRVSSGEDNSCPVHHVPLKKEKLKIIYGLIVEPCDIFDRAKSSQKYFPYANSVVYGGCIITPDSPKDEEVLYCSKCREVEKTWPCIEMRDTPMITTLPAPRITKLPTNH